MKHRGAVLFLTLCCLLLVGCGDDRDAPGTTALDALTHRMVGSFSSAAQAAADPEYFEIHLHMAPIWPDRVDGRWLYVEQAVGSMPEKPYRQRVYQVVTGEEAGVFESRVFELPDDTAEQAAVGTWKDAAPLAALSLEDLVRREGCTVFLRPREDGSYAGSTDGPACLSDFQGSTYATSEVEVFDDRIVSWDRGFDAEGEQVWGAVKGGYVFDRIEAP